MKTGVTLEEAQNLLLDRIKTAKGELVPLTAAHGRVVARDIYSAKNVPSFRRSPFDGYALQVAATKEATAEQPARLTEIRARFAAQETVTAGTVIKLMTGCAGSGRRERSHSLRSSAALRSSVVCTGAA